jgi:hypothetical protein
VVEHGGAGGHEGPIIDRRMGIAGYEIRAKLVAARIKDFATSATQVGPHRDDVVFELEGAMPEGLPPRAARIRARSHADRVRPQHRYSDVRDASHVVHIEIINV